MLVNNKKAINRQKTHTDMCVFVCKDSHVWHPLSIWKKIKDAPDPAGELTTLLRLPSWMGRGLPLSIPHPIDAFGVLVSVLSTPSYPPWTAPWLNVFPP